MAINSIDHAKKYAEALDKQVVQTAVTGFFADNVLKAQFVGADTVLIPEMDFVGLGNYDRNNGFPDGAITVTHGSYKLSQDRGRELQLDRMDMDETGIANLAGQTLKEFVRTKVVPEMDAYNLSKLAGVASTHSNEKAFDADKVFELFNAMTIGVQSVAGFGEELVCFVDPTAYAAMMNSAEITKSITVSDFKQGELNTKVKSINGVAIIPVAADRMKTAYTFNPGSDGAAGGFTAASGAKNINMLVLPKNGASLVKKTEKLRIFEPDQNQNADAYLFQYRVYYDIFVKKSGLKHVYAATSAQ